MRVRGAKGADVVSTDPVVRVSEKADSHFSLWSAIHLKRHVHSAHSCALTLDCLTLSLSLLVACDAKRSTVCTFSVTSPQRRLQRQLQRPRLSDPICCSTLPIGRQQCITLQKVCMNSVRETRAERGICLPVQYTHSLHTMHISRSVSLAFSCSRICLPLRKECCHGKAEIK